MKALLVIAAIVPVVAGLFVALPYLYKEPAADPGVEVMVAAHDLQVGTRVEEHDIKIIRVPAADLPPGAPRRRSDVLGHLVIEPIAKGRIHSAKPAPAETKR